MALNLKWSSQIWSEVLAGGGADCWEVVRDTNKKYTSFVDWYVVAHAPITVVVLLLKKKIKKTGSNCDFF